MISISERKAFFISACVQRLQTTGSLGVKLEEFQYFLFRILSHHQLVYFLQNLRYQNIEGTTALYETVGGQTGYPVATLPLDATNLFPAVGTTLQSYADHEYKLNSGYPYGSSGGAGEFVWSGSGTSNTDTILTTTYTAGIGDGIWIHIDHPLIPSWGAVSLPIGPLGNGAAGPTGVRNSGFAPLQSTEITDGSLRQSSYYFYATGSTFKEANISKMAFEEYDQYLLGPNSCGAYMFMSPINNTGAINVDGSNQLSIKTLEFGSKNSIQLTYSRTNQIHSKNNADDLPKEVAKEILLEDFGPPEKDTVLAPN
mgnify:CR=1 FL=1